METEYLGAIDESAAPDPDAELLGNQRVLGGHIPNHSSRTGITQRVRIFDKPKCRQLILKPFFHLALKAKF